MATVLRKSLLVNTHEQESDPIYGNVHVSQRTIAKELPIEDEGDLIEHDLLNLVEQEQQKEEQQQRNTPPALPIKQRTVMTTAFTTVQDNNFDVDIEPTLKLVHPGKDRPRRTNVRRPIKRSANGTTNDSSSDGGLLTDENDDNSIGDILPTSPSELQITSSLSTIDPPASESPPS
jgi:hypothetical protein